MVDPPRWKHGSFHHRGEPGRRKDAVYRTDTLQLVCLLPILLGQLPDPLILVVTGVHAQNLLDRQKINGPAKG
jgi:hypothetical protein